MRIKKVQIEVDPVKKFLKMAEPYDVS